MRDFPDGGALFARHHCVSVEYGVRLGRNSSEKS
jgi:hypothetical protein